MRRRVAIKCLHPATAPHRLRREALLAARLDHPLLVMSLDVTTLHDQPALVMPYIEGQTLEQWLRGGSTPPPSCTPRLQVARAACRALAEAHARGVVHGDVSPANLVVCGPDEVRLLDWGMAHTLEEDPALLPCAGGGTPGFTAPEVVRGGVRSVASDLWSLAAVVRWLMAGADGPHIRRLTPVLLRMLADDPSARPASMDPLVEVLETLRSAPPRRPWRGMLWASIPALALLLPWTLGGFPRSPGVEPPATDPQAWLSSTHALVDQGQLTLARERVRQALSTRPDPEAVGLAMQLASLPARAVQSAAFHPPCADWRPLGAPGDVLCLVPDGVERWRAGVRQWHRTMAWRDVRILPDQVLVVDHTRVTSLLDRRTGEDAGQWRGAGLLASTEGHVRVTLDRLRLVADPSEGWVWGRMLGPHGISPCPGAIVTAVAAHGHAALSCASGSLWRWDATGRYAYEDPSLQQVWDHLLLRETSAGIGLVVAHRSGVVMTVDGVRRTHTFPEAVAGVWESHHAGQADGTLLVAGSRGTLRRWDPASGLTLEDFGLVRHARQHPWGAIEGAQEDRWLRWSPADRPGGAIHQHPHGWSAVLWEPGSPRIHATDGVGQLVTLEMPGLTPVRTLRVADGVTKALLWDRASGGLTVVAMNTPGPQRVPASGPGTLALLFEGDTHYRDAAWLTPDRLALMNYNHELRVVDAQGRTLRRADLGMEVRDIAPAPDGSWALWAGNLGALRSRGDAAPERVVHRGPWTHAAAGHEGAMALAEGNVLAVFEPDGRLRWEREVRQPVWSLAWIPERALLVAGLQDGTLQVSAGSDGAAVAMWTPHRERVSGLAFSEDGRSLVSVGWDGMVRWTRLDGLPDRLDQAAIEALVPAPAGE
jgi:hypothetical protein